jgi:hypothetical protein
MVPENEKRIDYKLWLLHELWHWKCYHGHSGVVGREVYVMEEERNHVFHLSTAFLPTCAYCVSEVERLIAKENEQRWNEIYYHKLGYRVTRPRVRGLPPGG